MSVGDPRFHHANAFGLAMCGLYLVGTVLFEISLARGPLPSRLALIALILIAIVVVDFITCLADMRHTSRLCGRCLAGMPLDGSDLVGRNRIWLWVWHRPYLLILIVVIEILAAWYDNTAGRTITQYIVASTTTNITACGCMALQLYCGRVHHRLDWWCPYCNHGDNGGGPDEHAPEPDPVVHRPVSRHPS